MLFRINLTFAKQAADVQKCLWNCNVMVNREKFPPSYFTSHFSATENYRRLEWLSKNLFRLISLIVSPMPTSMTSFLCFIITFEHILRLFLLFLLLTLNKQMLAGYGLTGALLDLRQFLGTEIPLNMMKNAFYFTLKSLFVLKIFKLLFWLFGHVEKRLD